MDSVAVVPLTPGTPDMDVSDKAFDKPAGVPRVNSQQYSELAPKIQVTVAKNANSGNTQPTVVPAPQKQFFGTLGQRHAICVSGLPNNGKAFVAKELGWYLEFFHGARVEYFQVEQYFVEGRGKEADAQALLADVSSFLRSASGLPMTSPSKRSARVSSDDSSDDESFSRRRMTHTDAGRVAIVIAPRMGSMTELSDEAAKAMWTSTWSCINGLDRDWIRRRLEPRTSGLDCKLMFIEIELTDPKLRQQHADAARPLERQRLDELRDWFELSYTPLGRSASSETDLSYLRYRNFRDMETHRMHGYLRMRVAQFLSVLRPWKHTVYLSRHGAWRVSLSCSSQTPSVACSATLSLSLFSLSLISLFSLSLPRSSLSAPTLRLLPGESTYNVEKKLGGDPGLSSAGNEYARRLGEYSASAIQCNPHTGKKVAARLWTSSLQRTELTAAQIPHPEHEAAELETRTEVRKAFDPREQTTF